MNVKHHALIAIACVATAFPGLSQTPSTSAPTPAATPPLAAPVNSGGPLLSDPINADADLSPKPPVLALSPREQAAHFILQPGYRLEPVLADPIIQEPTAIAFDGNGRMFVLEDRGYMKDADGTGARDPVSRISRHEDADNDGVYEKSTVFVDHLVFPRFVLPYGPDTILAMETDQDDIWKYTDTDRDGVADKRELFAGSFGRSGNVEHQQAFLYRGLDNWLYSSVNAFRIRETATGVIREATGPNGAQWGVTQDDDGKIWFQGGASGVPSYFQFPIVYGAFTIPDRWDPDFTISWGAPIRLADMQQGLGNVRQPDGSLIRVTGSAGNDIVRAHRLPADLQGHYLYGEPVARIVRRVIPSNEEGLTRLANAYTGNEFIKSTDPLFRPVDMATAPDGTVYIVDMYRGIIQDAQWNGKGTYLRAKVEQYQLDKVHSLGRIWRLSYDGLPRDTTRPRMHEETPAQLVAHLSHPNGWWRDTAQQLLVLRGDESVVPALEALARSSGNLLARFHALWTLEGLGALEGGLVRELLKDANPRVRIQAVRASETLYKAGDKSLAADYAVLTKDAQVDVAIQALLTLNTLKVPAADVVVKATQTANPARGVQLVANTILNPSNPLSSRGGRGGPPAFTRLDEIVIKRGQTVYEELCFACHGADGQGTPRLDGPAGATMAPSLVGSPRVQGHRDYLINVLLHGITGPIAGAAYPEAMVPMGGNKDQWIADVASYVRNAFGNAGSFVTEADVARVRAISTGRTQPWTFAELEALLPKRLIAQPTWKITASQNADNARNALSFASWNSGALAGSTVWVQVELPGSIRLAEVQFTVAQPGGGRGGRGAAPAAVPAVASRLYRVDVSSDGTAWRQVAQVQGVTGLNSLPFAPVDAKFVRVIQVSSDETNGLAWIMNNLGFYEAGEGVRTGQSVL